MNDFIAALERLDWFNAVGTPLAIDPREGLTVGKVTSWEDAALVIASRQTDEFCTESQNDLYAEWDMVMKGKGKITRAMSLEFNDWIEANRQWVTAVAMAACKSARIPAEVGAKYLNILRRMIQKRNVIFRYDEVIKCNRLYCYVADLLLAGHCVCGWRGEYPQGWLVVF